MSDYFKRDESIYANYVCPNCFEQPHKCTCKVFPTYYLIWIDEGMQEHIKILNDKGYDTKYSCESHEPANIIYVNFDADYITKHNLSVPEGFKYAKSRYQLEHSYNKKMSMEDFEKDKKKHLNILLEWCKNLPELD